MFTCDPTMLMHGSINKYCPKYTILYNMKKKNQRSNSNPKQSKKKDPYLYLFCPYFEQGLRIITANS